MEPMRSDRKWGRGQQGGEGEEDEQVRARGCLLACLCEFPSAGKYNGEDARDNENQLPGGKEGGGREKRRAGERDAVEEGRGGEKRRFRHGMSH